MSSSFFEKPVPSDMAFIGEIGLHGELRSVRGSFLLFFLGPLLHDLRKEKNGSEGINKSSIVVSCSGNKQTV